MIVLTLNIYVVGGCSKNHPSVTRIFSSYNLVIVFVQETMVLGDKARFIFSQIIPISEMESTESSFLSGGMLSAYNSRRGRFTPFHTSTCILLSRNFMGFDLELNLLNWYGPYADRESFWNNPRWTVFPASHLSF